MILAIALLLQVADSTRPCVVEIDRAEHTVIRDAGDGQFNYFVSRGFTAHCRDDPATNLRSDSAAYYSLTGRLDLVGRVRVEDPTLLLTANAVTYLTRTEAISAAGAVDATNRRTGTRIRGPSLEYARAAPGIRDTATLYATGRPTIDYQVAGPADTVPPEPYQVIGDRVRQRGDDRIWAAGRVTVERSDFAARGDSLWLDFTAGTGQLLREPSVQTRGEDTLTVRGRLLQFGFEERKLTALTAYGAGDARGRDFTLTGDTLAFAFVAGELEHVEAWGDSSPPRVAAPRYDITADSLALDTPEQRLTEARGYGRALAITRPEDSTRTEPDWLAGDTLYAQFGAAAADTAGRRENRLERVRALGTARAFYLVFNEDDPDAPPGYSYARGAEIRIALDGDGVRQVEVTGSGDQPADGVYLKPQRNRPPAGRPR